MKKQDFILWLRGYFAGIDKTRPIDEIINELFDKIEQLDINITEKVIERIIEKEYPIFPNTNPYTNQNPYPYGYPIVSMYGCVTPYGNISIRNSPETAIYTTTNKVE